MYKNGEPRVKDLQSLNRLLRYSISRKHQVALNLQEVKFLTTYGIQTILSGITKGDFMKYVTLKSDNEQTILKELKHV